MVNSIRDARSTLRLVLLPVALSACSAVKPPGANAPPATRTQASLAVPDTPRPAASAARPAPLMVEPRPVGVPVAVATSLAQLVADRDRAHSAGPASTGDAGTLRIKVREMSLASNGSSALVARGEGDLCRESNCAVGVFEKTGDEFRPVLLAMSSGEPEIYPIGAQGRPGLVLNHIDGPHLLRATRYRWDGAEYKADACTQYDRVTNAAGRCEFSAPGQVAIYSGTLPILCRAIAGAAKSAINSPMTVPMIQEAFLLQRSETQHAQVLRMPPASDESRQVRPTPLVACLRRAGLKLRQLTTQTTDAGAVSLRWEAQLRTPSGSGRFELTWAETRALPHAMLMVGILLAPTAKTASYFTRPTRSTTSWESTRVSEGRK